MLTEYMNIAINEAKKSLNENNLPVGCVIIKNNEIIATAHNEEFWHAEILCIQLAQKKLGKFLKNCILFSSLQPCPMCLYAIKLAKISKLVFGAKSTIINRHKLEIIENIESENCSELIKKFFQNKRK